MAKLIVAPSSGEPGRGTGLSLAQLLARPRFLPGEGVALAGLLLLIVAAYLVRLGSVVISDMDEGTYLYAGKLVAEGLAPYRDFLLTHPPLLILLAAAWEWAFGSDIMAARVAYMVVVVGSTAPLYAITRSLARSQVAGILSVAVYTTGMVVLANMGRTVRLEPMMNAFIIGVFACYLLRPDSVRFRLLVGALLAAAVLVKLVAIVPAGFLVLGDVIWAGPGRRSLQLWGAAAIGGALVLVPAALLLLGEPNFVDQVIRAQIERPGLPLHTRLHYLTQNFTRYPLIPVALVAALWLIAWARDPRVRIVSLVALGSTLMLVLAFKTYFAYYIVQALPWIAVVFAVAAVPIARRLAGRWAAPLVAAGAVVLAVAAPALYGEVYHRTAHDHVSSPTRIVALLREGNGYVYSMYPAFALWSRREPYPWPYATDSMIARITGRIGDRQFTDVFAGSQALVLWPGELAEYPLARAYVEQHFRVAYEDAYYVLWVRDDAR